MYQDQGKKLVIQLRNHHKLWRKSSIGWLREVHGHGFGG